MNKAVLRLVGLLAGLAATALVEAVPVYVIDHLAIGMHESKSLTSPILRVLPTGTALEVVTREDSFIKVRAEDGTEGWVDASYVMDDKPAQLALLELEARHVDARDQLEVARAEIESLTVKLESLQTAEAIQESNEVATSDTLREMQHLAEENQTLLDELEMARLAVLDAKTNARAAGNSGPVLPGLTTAGGALGLGLWHWIMIAALMVLAFGLGGYLVDWGVRRRHGGFRI